MKKGDELQIGTIRVKVDGLVPVVKTKSGWAKTKFDVENIKEVASLFKSHNYLDVLVDSKDAKFLKGFLSPEKLVRGARINVLPNGKKLDKAYSLFSPHLTIHDELSNEHWDVIYQNPNGKFAYLYTEDKRQNSKKNKYKKVDEFDKVLPKLVLTLDKVVKKGDLMALPLYTLLKTYMRVGNEMYYKATGHKGLTTLSKENIKVAGNEIFFDYVGKDGVPIKIKCNFNKDYSLELSKKLKKLKEKDFVFTSENKHPLTDIAFEKAFFDYCGKRFYPHIVRSHFATYTVRKFLKENKHPTKEDVKKLYLFIADKLGHKKFSKKKGDWETCYTVTIHHYISPDLVKKVESKIKRV